MRDINGLATGIGSLPHKQVQPALDLIFKYTPRIPFWPQLPQRDARERMVIQSSEGLPCLRLQGKDLVFDSSDQESELARFYEHVICADSEYFKISPDFAAGLWQFHRRLGQENLQEVEFIKAQICGPFTFAASINDASGKPLLHDAVFLQAVIEGLALKARWQIGLFKKFAKPIILFFDEPYLSGFGSAFTALERNELIKGLSQFCANIKASPALLGVHCCGNTDWSIFTDTPGIDIISFDAYNFLERILLYADNLGAFFRRGGMLAWGMVPTGDFSSKINTRDLASRLDQALKLLINKGIEEKLLRNRLLLTPSCGLGTLTDGKAEPIFKCLDELVGMVSRESV